MDKKKKAAKRKARAVKASRAGGSKPAITRIREQIERKLVVEKASLADYVRLVQLEQELTQEEPRETKVTWVDPRERGKTGGQDFGE